MNTSYIQILMGLTIGIFIVIIIMLVIYIATTESIDSREQDTYVPFTLIYCTVIVQNHDDNSTHRRLLVNISLIIIGIVFAIIVLLMWLDHDDIPRSHKSTTHTNQSLTQSLTQSMSRKELDFYENQKIQNEIFQMDIDNILIRKSPISE